MGLLRVLLAIAVIFSHTLASLQMTSGRRSVEAFFIISGFYMALILNEKYKGPGSTWLFYTNRLWRLMPLYWLLTAAVFVVSVLAWQTGHDPLWLKWWLQYGDQLSFGTKAYLVFVNLFALGQDSVFYFGLNEGHLELVKNFRLTEPPLYRFLFVGQSWSLSVEIFMYILAPYVVRRRWLIGTLFLVLLAIRLRVEYSSWGIDPWIGRFLPLELPLFFLGVLAYYAYTYVRTWEVPQWVSAGLLGTLVSVTLCYQWLPESIYTSYAYFFLFAVTVPFAFQLTKNNKRDAALGEYSFPIYIAHTLPLVFVERLCEHYGWSHDVAAAIEIGCVLPLAWLLIRYVGDPIEVLRARRAKKLAVAQALAAV